MSVHGKLYKMKLENYSFGIGDRFGQQGLAQLEALIKAKEDCYIQIRISNTGEGVAWSVDLNFNPGLDFKLSSMYPHRIIDQLNYETTIIETFKLKPVRKGELHLPRTIINYKLANEKRYYIVVPALTILAI